MKLLPTVVLSTMLALSLSTSATAGEPTKPQNPDYNAELAKKYGADDRGMKSYVMVTLVTGPNDDKITDKKQRGELFKGHFANMERLANEGKLVLAGPYVEARPKRGLLLFNVKTLEEAEALVKTDPTVEAGVFSYEMAKYYGSAAIMQVNEVHGSLSKN